MKIFAIRDRLLNYFQRPVMADHAPDVVAAVATAINGGDKNDFCQKPEDFEIWQVGEFDQESGAIIPKLTIVTNCLSLVRTGVREGGAPTRTAPTGATGRSGEAPSGSQGPYRPSHRPIQDKAPPAPSDAHAARQEPEGGARVTHPHLREGSTD